MPHAGKSEDENKSRGKLASKPPRYALRFLERFCPPDLFESIEGDLLEQFEREVEEVGGVKARGGWC